MMRNRGLVLYAVCLMGVIWIAHPTLAQDQKPDRSATVPAEDTLRVGQEGLIGTGKPGVESEPDTAIIKKVSTSHIPRKSALFSAALPGLGQIYNGKYWKVPIIYGGFAALGYAVVLTNDKYQLFRRALIAVQNNAPEENPLRGIRNGRLESVELLNRGVEAFRRDRDFMIILIAGLYGLQIMDAIVDAHLIEFDVNEDLSLRLHPSVSGGDADAYLAIPNVGMSLTFNIK